MSGTISFIVPTIGRPHLSQTLASIETWPGDDVLMVGAVSDLDDHRVTAIPCPRGNDWGATERRLAIRRSTKSYLAFLDDDDVYLAGTRAKMDQAIRHAPGRPTIFRMIYPNGRVLWRDPVLRVGNVGTPMLLVPNDPDRLGTWSSRRECDFDFLASSAWDQAAIVWATDIIARIGHDDG